LSTAQKSGFFHRQFSNDEESLRLDLKERVLVLIQQWAKDFGRSRSYPIFLDTYNRLVADGVKFPVPHQDEVAPVFTPPKKKVFRPPPKIQRFVVDDASLQQANEQAELLYDMLSASESAADVKRNDLIQELRRSCEVSQNRCIVAVQQGPPETVLGPLLSVNEKLLDVLRYYDGLASDTMSRFDPDAEAKKAKQQEDVKETAEAEDAQSNSDSAPEPVDLFGLAPPPAEHDSNSSTKHKKKKKKKKKTKSHQQNGEDDATPQFDMHVGAAEPSDDDSPPASVVASHPVAIPKLAPPPEKRRRRRKSSRSSPASNATAAPAHASPSTAAVVDDIFNLDSVASALPESKASQEPGASNNSAPAPAPAAAAADPLDELFFGGSSAAAAPTTQTNNDVDEEDEDDEFLMLAMRDDTSKQKKNKPSKPATTTDIFDMF
jgi:GAT domain